MKRPAHGAHEAGQERDDAQDTLKRREIRLSAEPPGQAEQAVRLLAGMDGIEVALAARPCAIDVSYRLDQYTLEGLEHALSAEGFHLDNSLLSRLTRELTYFCEDTQLRNLRSPQRLIKRSNEVYVKAWEHHKHGDHDDMPPELRDYK